MANSKAKFTGFFLVGGIYTVIRSKAAVTVDELGNNYCLFGPYNESSVQTEVEVMEPDSPVMSGVIQSMRDRGMKVCDWSDLSVNHFCFDVLLNPFTRFFVRKILGPVLTIS